tara:strand:+ start:98 stop:232 length:135 start_codon:yes stop_codon:yes gene_type:complete
MGCGCNKKVEKPKKVSEKRNVLRKMWDKAQQVEKPLIVKEINKK